jgi:molecular chaperone GrpE
MSPRRTPDEDAVREQLREQPAPEEGAGEPRDRRGDASAGNGGGSADGGSSEGGDTGFVEAPPGDPSDEAEPGEGGPGSPQADEATEPDSTLQEERDRYLELAQRTQADFENYRKRAARDAAAAGARAKAGLVRELLPVVDNLERALVSAGEGESELADGLRLVLSELGGVLARNGIAAFEPVGEPFDPAFHEALSTHEADGAEPGIVLEVVEKGYRLDDAVLRPARVVVSALAP